MPKLNPKHIRHAGGFLSPQPNGHYWAYVRVNGKRYRAKLDSLELAKLWIETTVNTFETKDPPLTRAQLLDAQAACAILPPGVSLRDLARAFITNTSVISDATETYLSSITLADAADIFFTAQTDLSPRTLSGYRGYVNRLITFAGPNTDLLALSDATINDLIRDFSPSVRNASIRHLSAFFQFFIKKKVIYSNPCTGVDKAKSTPPPLGIISPDTLKELLSRAQRDMPEIVPYIAVGAFAGTRPNETLRITPERIGEEYIILDAAITKTAAARTISISENLRAWLNAYPFSVPTTDPSGINKRIRRLAQQKPVLDLPHDYLRHSYASYSYELTKNAALVAAEMGHRGTDMFFKHYRALASPGSGAKWFNIMP